MTSLQNVVPQSGFYYFPAPGLQPDLTTAQKHQAMNAGRAKAAIGPSGLLLYQRAGIPDMFARQMTIQFAADIAVMLLAAFLLAQLSPAAGYLPRLILVLLMGFFSVLRVDIPLW